MRIAKVFEDVKGEKGATEKNSRWLKKELLDVFNIARRGIVADADIFADDPRISPVTSCKALSQFTEQFV